MVQWLRHYTEVDAGNAISNSGKIRFHMLHGCGQTMEGGGILIPWKIFKDC